VIHPPPRPPINAVLVHLCLTLLSHPFATHPLVTLTARVIAVHVEEPSDDVGLWEGIGRGHVGEGNVSAFSDTSPEHARQTCCNQGVLDY
jgi:hypothetical protein